MKYWLLLILFVICMFAFTTTLAELHTFDASILDPSTLPVFMSETEYSDEDILVLSGEFTNSIVFEENITVKLKEDTIIVGDLSFPKGGRLQGERGSSKVLGDIIATTGTKMEISDLQLEGHIFVGEKDIHDDYTSLIIAGDVRTFVSNKDVSWDVAVYSSGIITIADKSKMLVSIEGNGTAVGAMSNINVLEDSVLVGSVTGDGIGIGAWDILLAERASILGSVRGEGVGISGIGLETQENATIISTANDGNAIHVIDSFIIGENSKLIGTVRGAGVSIFVTQTMEIGENALCIGITEGDGIGIQCGGLDLQEHALVNAVVNGMGQGIISNSLSTQPNTTIISSTFDGDGIVLNSYDQYFLSIDPNTLFRTKNICFSENIDIQTPVFFLYDSEDPPIIIELNGIKVNGIDNIHAIRK